MRWFKDTRNYPRFEIVERKTADGNTYIAVQKGKGFPESSILLPPCPYLTKLTSSKYANATQAEDAVVEYETMIHNRKYSRLIKCMY